MTAASIAGSDGPEVSLVWQSGARSASAATQLLEAEVARFTGAPAESVQVSRSCRHCGSTEHGRPVVLPNSSGQPPSVSLSRALDVVLVAVCDGGLVGVDLERSDSPRFAGFEAVALNPYELAPTVSARATTWVRKESLLKATGHGLQVDPRLVRLSDPDQPPRLLEWAALDPPRTAVWMRDVDIAGHRASVTVLTDAVPRLTVRRAAEAALRR